MNIRRDDLEIISKFASNDENRNAINGIRIEPIPGKGVLLVATNGRSLGVLLIEDAAVTEKAPITFPLWVLEFIPRKIKFLQLIFPTGKDTRVTIIGKNMPDMTAEVIEKTYPKWRIVIPTAPFIPCNINVSGKVLQPFLDAAKILCASEALSFRTSDELSPISVFTDNPNFYGVIMPMRYTGIDKTIPDWVKQ